MQSIESSIKRQFACFPTREVVGNRLDKYVNSSSCIGSMDAIALPFLSIAENFAFDFIQ